MAIGERRLDCVVTDRLQLVNRHITLAHLQRFLSRAVPADVGRRRMHAQELERQPEMRAIVEGDFEHARRGVQHDVGGTKAFRTA